MTVNYCTVPMGPTRRTGLLRVLNDIKLLSSRRALQLLYA